MAAMNGAGGPGPSKAGGSQSIANHPREESQSRPISTEPPGILRDPTTTAARKMNTDIPNILPHQRVFPIQIGGKTFKLSGASISSDGMYFLFISLIPSTDTLVVA